jgi:hypothetical protein
MPTTATKEMSISKVETLLENNKIDPVPSVSVARETDNMEAGTILYLSNCVAF